jgi:DNA (cytosine-5)-methyltransferase 1
MTTYELLLPGLGRGGTAVDLVAGGFPCQPVSTMGKRRAQDDPRWGWPWFADVLRAVRTRYVLVENVVGLLDTGLGDVLGGLHSLGFDAEWSVLSACAFGAPHTRERLFVLAYPSGADGFEALQVPPALQGGRPVAGAEDRGEGWPGWLHEPALDRVAHGVPRSVGFEELTALGNAVVPQVGEHLGRLFMAHANAAAVTATP